MTIPVVRKRAKRPKTRTGCRTCRARHIKCDEDRPACRRCRASGKVCLGYDVVRKAGGAAAEQPVFLAMRLPTLCPVPPVSTCGLSPMESCAFDFFRARTVRMLPGCAWTLSWERLALRMGQHEPAVAHAAVALGAIHRAAGEGEGEGQQQMGFALAQYNKAMGCVRKYIEALDERCSDSDVEVVLLVSLLFFCFEVLHGEDARATMHLRTGLRILYERLRRRDGGVEETKRVVTMRVAPRDNMDVILQTFVRLDGDLTIVGEDEPYLFPVCRDRLPTSFNTLEEAMVHLDAIGSKCHDFCRDIVVLADQQVVSKRPDFEYLDDDVRNCLACAASRTIDLDSEPDLLARMHEIKSGLEAWMTAMSSVPMAEQRQSAQLLTQIHFFYIWIVVSTWRDENEMLVDRFDEQFERVLGLAEQYVELHLDVTHSQTSPSAITRQAFSLGTDLVPCVALIAFKCRNSSIRRRCVQLLRTINLQGVFNSHFLASFVQVIWELEEKRAREISGFMGGVDMRCEDVPEKARFVEIELSSMDHTQDFNTADVGRLVYATYDEKGRLVGKEEMFRVERPGVGRHVCKTEEPGLTPFWMTETKQGGDEMMCEELG